MFSRSVRDSQRIKVYGSEWQTYLDKKPPDYRTVAECQEFVDEVLASPAWKHLYPSGPSSITVTDGRGRRSAVAFALERRIAMPKIYRHRFVVLHELAHFPTANKDLASHGPEFVSTYLYLTSEFLTPEEHAALVSAMASQRVKTCDYLGDGVYDGTTVRHVTVPESVSVADPVIAEDTACLSCGQNLATNRARFCSDTCRYTYHNRLRRKRSEAERNKVCEACRTKFTATRSDAKTCSARCRQRLKRSFQPVL